VTVSKGLTWLSIVLVLAIGLIHFIDAPSSFDDATYKGLLFVANGLVALVAAVGIYMGAKSWGWGLGLFLAAATIVGYVISRTAGLPGLDPDDWYEPLGIVSLIVEGSFTLLASYMFINGTTGAKVRLQRNVLEN
jgi:hypothetical protein